MQEASATIAPDLTETIRKLAEVANMPVNVRDSIYPTTALFPSPVTGPPQLRLSRSRKQREDADTGNAGSTEDKEDTRPDHHGTEDGGEDLGDELCEVTGGVRGVCGVHNLTLRPHAPPHKS